MTNSIQRRGGEIVATKRPKVILVTQDTLRKSSFVARLEWLKRCQDSQFDIGEEFGWPSDASTSERERNFAAIVKAKAEADVVILHRVLFDSYYRQLFFSDRKPVIFDYDDAIYSVPSGSYHQELKSVAGMAKRAWRLLTRGHPDYAGRYRPLVAMLRSVQGVSAGNPHLARFASRYCSNVAVVPTVVDVNRFQLKAHSESQSVTIGWYGSPDNHWYLSNLAEPFGRMRQSLGDKIRFSVISSHRYEHARIPFEWIPWRAETELEDILKFDIGIMPLTDDEWARGKSGNKAIYYMAAGIAPVVSPVGVNADIVRHGKNGFWARTSDEWVTALGTLAGSVEMRRTLGANARATAVKDYSREAAAAKLSTLVAQVASINAR